MLKILGCDVSRGRTSETALVFIDHDPEAGESVITEVIVERLTSEPEVIEFIASYISEREVDYVGIDATGGGGGVYDHLVVRFPDKVWDFVASRKASVDEEHGDKSLCASRNSECKGCREEKLHTNMKTRVIYAAQRDAYRGLIRIRHAHPRLIAELPKYQLKKVGGRYKSEDPKKSPDVADAFIVGYYFVAVPPPEFWID